MAVESYFGRVLYRRLNIRRMVGLAMLSTLFKPSGKSKMHIIPQHFSGSQPLTIGMYSSSPSPSPTPDPPPDLRYRDNIDFQVAMYQGSLFTLEGPWYGLYDHILNAVIFSDIGDKVKVTTRTYPQYPLTLDTDSGHHDFDPRAQDLGRSTPPRSSTIQDDWSSPGVIVSYSPVEIRVFGLDVDDPQSPSIEMSIVGSDDPPGDVGFVGSEDDPQTSPSVEMSFEGSDDNSGEMSSVDSDDGSQTPSVEMSFADSDDDSQTPSIKMSSVGSDNDSGEIGSDDSLTPPIQNRSRNPSVEMSLLGSDDDPRTPPPAGKLKSTRIPDFAQIQYRIRLDRSIDSRFLMVVENKKEPSAQK
ncbi:hypothetical protein H0H93_001963, partial [Arthromyces matolae]